MMSMWQSRRQPRTLKTGYDRKSLVDLYKYRKGELNINMEHSLFFSNIEIAAPMGDISKDVFSCEEEEEMTDNWLPKEIY